MKRRMRILAAVVALAVLLSGCRSILQSLLQPQPVAFRDMEYTRPDLSSLDSLTAQCRELASGGDVDAFMEPFWEFYDLYVNFCTAYSLAHIYQCMDMSDIYWEQEYNYCKEQAAQVQSAYEDLLYDLADSPLRQELEGEDYFGEGFFEDFDGESMWTEELTALMTEEGVLINEYYDLMEDFDLYQFTQAQYEDLAELYVELIGLRQQIATEAGYDSFPEFAYDYYFDRDYTPQQAEQYTEQIRQKLGPLYYQVDFESYLDVAYTEASEKQTFSFVKTASMAMGGVVEEAFRDMEELELYHISPGENKMDISFEVFLPAYYAPFVFVNPTQTNGDKLSFAHEFGHFCNDYASFGTAAGMDVAEIFSQGMEYLMLSYSSEGEELSYVKMVDSLCVFVEQSAYASFEQQVYGLTGEDLTVKNIEALYKQVMDSFGFGIYEMDYRDYVAVQHFFISPMYVISYVVSNDAAMQLYQLEQTERGKGLDCYMDGLDTEQTQLLAFLQEAELESPFAQGRVESLKETFQSALGGLE